MLIALATWLHLPNQTVFHIKNKKHTRKAATFVMEESEMEGPMSVYMMKYLVARIGNA